MNGNIDEKGERSTLIKGVRVLFPLSVLPISCALQAAAAAQGGGIGDDDDDDECCACYAAPPVRPCWCAACGDPIGG